MFATKTPSDSHALPRPAWAVIVLAVCAVACGRLGYDGAAGGGEEPIGGADGGEGDGGGPGDGGGQGDGGGDPPRGPFQEVQEVGAIASSFRDTDPSATGDRLELYFASNRPGGRGGMDIWMTSRPSIEDPWQAPKNVVELSSPAADVSPAVSPDGLTVYLASDRAGALGGVDIWRSIRPDRSSPWSSPVQVVELGSGAPDFPSESADGLSMVFCSERAGGGDLFASKRGSTSSSWPIPSPIAELNTNHTECVPSTSADGGSTYFSSDRPGGMGNRDLWFAERPAPGAPFTEPVVVTELNSPAHESDPWVSPDGRTILFTSTRTGDESIFQAVR